MGRQQCGCLPRHQLDAGTPVPAGTTGIELGLRDRNGVASFGAGVTCVVTTPRGMMAYAVVLPGQSDWAYTNYPDDFDGIDARPTSRVVGTYTVEWYVGQYPAARDSFTVR